MIASPSKQQARSTAVSVFAIVSPSDQLIYSCDLSHSDVARDDPPHLDEFILYSALDIVDRLKVSSSEAYLKVVDRFNDFMVSAFVPISSVRFLLLHKQSTNEDAIRIFFQESYIVYAKLVANFSYKIGSVITQTNFDRSIKDLGKRILV